jgi:hypothetical protein
MRFGTAKKDVVDNSDEVYLRTFKKGDTQVRFLTEIDEWIQFREHYTGGGDNKSFPCTKDRSTCPGCTSDDESVSRSANRYAANAILTRNGQVYAFKMGKSLVDRLSMRSDRNGGTIMNRDYVIIRSGTGLDTEYDVEQEEKTPVKASVYKDQLVDIEAVLESNFNALYGDQPAPKKSSRKVEDDEDEAPVRRKAKVVEEDDVPPSKPAVASSDDEQEVELDEAVVRDMSRAELLDLYAKAGLEADEDMSRKELADFLIQSLAD